VWHASVAVLGKHSGQWASSDVRRVHHVAHQLLEGVGVGKWHEETNERAYHLRRRLSDDELARLDPAWLAIPAVDMS
jgi:hypothetical protein